MNKTNLILLTLIISILSSCSNFLGIDTKTDKPKPDISTKSVRYLTISPINLTKFEVEVIDDELNLFKNNALIKIELEGSFNKKKEENIYFDEIIFLEKVDTLATPGAWGGCEITVNLLPNFSSTKKKKDKTIYNIQPEKVSFKTTLEYRLYTCGIGQNKIELNFANLRRSFELIQKK